MTTLQTCFRAVVMLATIGIVAKAWHLYGPSVAEMRAIGSRVVEVADELMSEYGQPDTIASDASNDPRLQQAAPFAGATPPPPGPAPQPILLATAESEIPTFAQQAVAEAPVAGAPAAPPTRLIPVVSEDPPSLAPASENARLDTAVARVDNLGAREGRLEPWGDGGRWYRFSCDVPWVDAPNYSRHFEAVAADAASAVEQVAAEIDAWRGTRSASNASR